MLLHKFTICKNYCTSLLYTKRNFTPFHMILLKKYHFCKKRASAFRSIVSTLSLFRSFWLQSVRHRRGTAVPSSHLTGPSLRVCPQTGLPRSAAGRASHGAAHAPWGRRCPDAHTGPTTKRCRDNKRSCTTTVPIKLNNPAPAQPPQPNPAPRALRRRDRSCGHAKGTLQLCRCRVAAPPGTAIPGTAIPGTAIPDTAIPGCQQRAPNTAPEPLLRRARRRAGRPLPAGTPEITQNAQTPPTKLPNRLPSRAAPELSHRKRTPFYAWQRLLPFLLQLHSFTVIFVFQIQKYNNSY